MIRLLSILSLAILVGLTGCRKGAGTSPASVNIDKYYQVEDITLPNDLDAQVGGLAFLPSGKLAACFHRGEVMVYDPDTNTWTEFARGLQEPLGISAVSDHELLVMQRPELTRIVDQDKDGVADLYETVSDQFGLTGNYHEFAFGPALTKDGTALIGLGTASNKAPTFSEVRGEWLNIGLDHKNFLKPKAEWKEVAPKAGRMYSRVPWRGWLLEVDLATGKTSPWASGFRTPNGILRHPNGLTIVTDNQGDWLGTNPVYVAEKGGFHGHIASLPWTKDWTDRDPLTIPVEELAPSRTLPAVQIPYSIMAHSPTQPILLGNHFSAFAGDLVIGEMNHPRLLRILLEKVGNHWQGAATPFLPDGAVTNGNNRLATGPDGSLWIGKSKITWPGSTGIQRLIPTGVTPPAIDQCKLTANGFEFHFTLPIDADTISKSIDARKYRYAYHAKYGSAELGVKTLTITSRTASNGGTTLHLQVDGLEKGFLYEFDFKNIRTTDGEPLLSSLIAYTINELSQ